jgi:hypothetical protein
MNWVHRQKLEWVPHPRHVFVPAPRVVSENYPPYCSSLTCSIQSTVLPSSFS